MNRFESIIIFRREQNATFDGWVYLGGCQALNTRNICPIYKNFTTKQAQRIWRSEAGPGEAAERAGAGAGELEAQAAGGRTEPGQADSSGHCAGKLLSPERRRTAVEHARQCGASERHACHLVHQPRGTQRYQPTQRNDEDALTRAIITLADRFGRYGYRRITIKLREAGWNVGKDRVERISRREGLKVPQKPKPRGRLWLNDGSCVRLRPEHQNHVWSYDFGSTFAHDGRTVRMLNLIDEHTRECLAIHVRRRINSADLIDVLADAMIKHGIPEYIRSDNGPEFVAKELRKWLARTGAATPYIKPGSPWENGYCESFNSKLRDEFLNGEIFYSLKEVQILAERWRIYYNTEPPHS